MPGPTITTGARESSGRRNAWALSERDNRIDYLSVSSFFFLFFFVHWVM